MCNAPDSARASAAMLPQPRFGKKPEVQSTFPLAGVIDSYILVRHEYKHNGKTVLFEDLLALLCGERLDIRSPHSRNKSHRNTCPMFLTSNSPLQICREDAAATSLLNTAM